MKRSYIKRSTKPIRKRTKPRRGQPTPAEKETERDRVYERCGGQCELHLMPNCWRGVIPKNGCTPWDHWHLVHLHGKRRFGWTEAQGNTLLGGCPECHLVGLHQKSFKPDLESIMQGRRDKMGTSGAETPV